MNIIGSPYKVTVLPQAVPLPTCAAVAVGEGLISVSRNKRAEFVVDGVFSGCFQLQKIVFSSEYLAIHVIE